MYKGKVKRFKAKLKSAGAKCNCIALGYYLDEEKSGTLKTGSVSKWLEEQGVLENTELPSGRKTRLPTEQGVKLGIETRQRTSQRGEEYTAVVYSKQARQFKRSQGMTPLEFRREDGDGVGTVE